MCMAAGTCASDVCEGFSRAITTLSTRTVSYKPGMRISLGTPSASLRRRLSSHPPHYDHLSQTCWPWLTLTGSRLHQCLEHMVTGLKCLPRCLALELMLVVQLARLHD